jgi:large subunit ribosomal protein L30
MGIKVKLMKSFSGAQERHKQTVFGLGLRKINDVKLLKDTPQIRGMIFAVKHLISHEMVKDEPTIARRKPRHIRNRDAARAKAQSASK